MLIRLNDITQPRPGNPVLLYTIAFLMAFCSVSYEILIASQLSRLLGEGMFVYPACIAAFILFMGLGSAITYYRGDKIPIGPFALLLLCECALTFTGALSITLINLTLYDTLYTLQMEAIVVGLGLACAIGFLSGQELPLLFHFCASQNIEPKQIRRIIFFDYLASLFASILCTVFFFSILGFFKASLLVAFLNLLIVGLILVIAARRGIAFPFGRSIAVFIAVTAGAFMLLAPIADRTENMLLKWAYLGNRNALLLAKKHTPYQQVLLFTTRKDYQEIRHTNQQILDHPGEYYLFAVLNSTLQFFEPFETGADPDHTYLFDPYVQLLPGMSKALILGGGDGLPARQAVRYPSLTTIDMVDIDEQWVRFSMTDPFMRLKNRGALSDPRINLHFGDAFKWVLTAKEKYDYIAVDFPSEPSSLAKIRTTSIQFLRDLGRILNDNGVAVLHSNTISSPLKLKLMAKTAQMAGFHVLWGHKPDSATWSAVEQIALFKSASVRDRFLEEYNTTYLKSGQYASTRESFGTLAFALLDAGDQWITFYDPLVARMPFPDQMELLKDALE